MEAVATGMSQYTTLFSSLGVAAILGWYLWYTTSVSFPRLSSQHLDRFDEMLLRQEHVVAELTRNFRELNSEQRHDFLDSIEAERKDIREVLLDIQSTFRCSAAHLIRPLPEGDHPDLVVPPPHSGRHRPSREDKNK